MCPLNDRAARREQSREQRVALSLWMGRGAMFSVLCCALFVVPARVDAQEFESPELQKGARFESRALPETDSSGTAARIADIDHQVASQELRLARVRTKRETLDRELVEVRAQVESLQTELRDLEKKKQEHLARVAMLNVEVARAQDRQRTLERLSRDRLRALYVYRPSQVMAQIFGNRERETEVRQGVSLSVGQASYLLSRVRSADRALLGELARSIEEQLRLQAELAAAATQVEQVREKVARRGGMLRTTLREKESMEKQLRAQEREVQAELIGLRAEAVRLENVLATLMSEDGASTSDADVQSDPSVQVRAAMRLDGSEASRESDPSLSRVKSKRSERWTSEAHPTGGSANLRGDSAPSSEEAGGPSSATQGPQKLRGQPLRSSESYEGVGLRAQRKELVVPARGTVIRGFGKQRHEEFADLVFRRGVEIAVVKDVRVGSIAPGRVTFLGELPGFGMVAIVDHGSRSYSLYGRLGKVLVEVGQTVTRGQPLAELIPTDRRGSNLYFEVRENGSPVNPRVFFPNL